MFSELIRAFRSEPELGVEVSTGKGPTRNRHLVEAGLAELGTQRRTRAVSAAVADADLVHHTYYLRRYLRRYHAAPRRAVTVVDMIAETHPEHVRLRNPHRAKRAFVAAADLVFCISEATRADLVAVYGEPAAPVIVTHLGVSDAFTAGAAKPEALPERYVLFVGKRGRYKDFAVLVDAFARAELPADVALVLVGGEPMSARERSRLEVSPGMAGRIVGPLRLSDRELSGAYGHAQAFVFPSRAEGFGLPTVEAMASGAAVVLADVPVHREVGGDAALYFDPGRADSLAEILVEILGDPALREEYAARGLSHAASFTWSETARRTAQAYREVL